MVQTKQQKQAPNEYTAIKMVGEGALGQVYKAKSIHSGRIVAVKALREHLQSQTFYRELFTKEVMITAKLNHQNLIKYIDSNLNKHDYFMVSEFINGWTLRILQKHYGRFPPLVAAAMTYQILEALYYLHQHNIIHSDLTSSNILLAHSGRIVVTDLGLAAQEGLENYRYARVGTAGYYSPEHVTSHKITTQSDIYCAGLIFFELIAGKKAVPAHKDSRTILEEMKKINLKEALCTDPNLKEHIDRFLRGTLEMGLQYRAQSSGPLKNYMRNLLVHYSISNPAAAIRQFLIETNLSQLNPSEPNRKQNIYHGNAIFKPQDTNLFRS